MVDLTRRKTVIGLGLLATGSGATFTSAAFNSTTTPTADLRVISDGRLTVRGNADDDPNIFDLNESPGEDIDFDNIDRSILPRATFADTPDSNGANGNINGDISLTVGIETNQNDTFDNILQIDNNTNDDRDVAIHFEEAAGGAGNNETYGDDVGSGTNAVSKNTVQTIYQFKADTTGDGTADTLISPEPNTTGVGGPNGGQDVDATNTASNQVKVASGGTLNIILDFDTNDGNTIGDINSAASGSGSEAPFGRGGGEDVDLLDSIVVGSEPTN